MNTTAQSSLCEALEARTFFAGTPLALRPLVDARHVFGAFQAFDKTYVGDVKTILFASGMSPSSQRAAFDQAVAGALNTLNSTIDADISDLPAQATLSATIQNQLTGSGTGSLQHQLAALTTPTGSGDTSAMTFRVSSQVDIGKTEASVLKEIVTSATGVISPATLAGDLADVTSAFANFSSTYDDDANNILFGSGTPSANRPAFDGAVATALNTLNTSITAAISNLPASVLSSLNPKIQSDLFAASGAGKSLQARLASISTPGSNNFFTMLVFNVQSKFKIVPGGFQVAGDIVSAIHKFNFAK
jgi:hypothetical protein